MFSLSRIWPWVARPHHLSGPGTSRSAVRTHLGTPNSFGAGGGRCRLVAMTVTSAHPHFSELPGLGGDVDRALDPRGHNLRNNLCVSDRSCFSHANQRIAVQESGQQDKTEVIRSAVRYGVSATIPRHVDNARLRSPPRQDKRGVDLISDTLPFGRLWYGEPNAINYAQFFSRSHDAVIRVCDAAGNVIEIHKQGAQFKEW
jgi:hypothetical protein